MMPKNGSSRSKRRARRLAIEQNLRYTEALRRSSTGERDGEQGQNRAATSGTAVTALEALHTTAEQLQATDPADTGAALLTLFHALALTATANTMIDEALLDAEFEVYLPGEGFLWDKRREHLDLAVDRLGSALAAPLRPSRSGQFRMLTPPHTAPKEYWPMCDAGFVVSPLDDTDKARQLLYYRTQAVALANKAIWEQTQVLLGHVLSRVRDPQHHTAFRIAALVMDEILRPNSGGARREISRRIRAITVGRRSTAELIADEQLMELLHESVAAATRHNGWSPMTDVSAALAQTDPDWMPERWGYQSDIKLIVATKQFLIRQLPRKGERVIEVRVRRASQTGTRR